MPEEFFDWLNNCPIQWYLKKQDKKSLSYSFYVPEKYQEDDDVMENPELYWKSHKGYIKVSEMDSTHIVNVIKMINSKLSRQEEGYPECYDNLYVELNERGIDTDFEIDGMFPSLDEEEDK